jgi:2,3-bisphosphoglycerate-independent phosphoglycerate mutase
VPELLAGEGGESVLRQPLPALASMAELGTVEKLAAIPPAEVPEALYLGMAPHEAQMAQGPLTVAALGADPPDRSTHFHLSLLSVQDGRLQQPSFIPSAEDEEHIWSQAQRLNTRSMTLLRGEHLDHALVWEGLGDFHTFQPKEVNGQPLRPHLPEGDAEKSLRRLIDDSANLLTDLELNQRRLDEGLPPLNILWPWGHGRRVSVPNLFLRRGARATVESESLRLQGLTRLAGYLHEDRKAFGKGLNVRLRPIANRATKRDLTLIVIESFAKLRSDAKLEELDWLVRELDRELLQPLMDDALRTRAKVSLLAPSTNGPGLWTSVEPQSPRSGRYPFDERALEERSVPTRDLSAIMDEELTAIEPRSAGP